MLWLCRREWPTKHWSTRWCANISRRRGRRLTSLLLDKLPEVLTHQQKLNRIHNLLRQLAETGIIVNSGGRRWPQWVLGTAGPA